MQHVLHRNIQDARAIDVTLGFVKPTNKVTSTINQHKRKYPQKTSKLPEAKHFCI